MQPQPSWFWTSVGILAAGLLFSYVAPGSADSIFYAVITALVTGGMVFVLSSAAGTASPAFRFLARIGAFGVFTTGAWLVVHSFAPAMANQSLMLLAMIGLGLGYSVFGFGRRPSAVLAVDPPAD